MTKLMKTLLAGGASALCLAAASQAATVTTADASDGTAGDEVAVVLAQTLLQGGTSVSSGITIVAGTQRYIGAAAQGGEYTDAQFGPISLDDGVILTTGNANTLTGPLNTVNETSDDTGTGGNADIDALRGMPGDTFNQTVLSFDFTLNDPSTNAVALDFLFGSEEFPDNGEPDTFAVFLTNADGDLVNFAEFADGEVIGVSDQTNFNDNTDGAFGVELNGLTDVLTLTALLDPDVIGPYTLTIALADTGDTLFDSAVFLANLRATIADTGGITDAVPVPGALVLFPLGIAALGAARRRGAK